MTEQATRAEAADWSGTYALVHAVLQRAADAAGITPFEARVLMSVFGAGGQVRSDELEKLMRIDGSAVRRATGVLRRRELLEANGPGGGPPSRGHRSTLTMTAAGVGIVLGMLELEEVAA